MTAEFQIDDHETRHMRRVLSGKRGSYLISALLILTLPIGSMLLISAAALYLSIAKDAFWLLGAVPTLFVLLFLLWVWRRPHIDMIEVMGVETHRFEYDESGVRYIAPRIERRWPWSAVTDWHIVGDEVLVINSRPINKAMYIPVDALEHIGGVQQVTQQLGLKAKPGLNQPSS